MSGFTTDDYGSPAVECPGCGDAYLHQQRIEVFVRDTEDAKQGTHVTIDYRNGVSIDRSMSGNPSSRRDGIKIDFECEMCGMASYTLQITQHKGNEFVSWEGNDE